MTNIKHATGVMSDFSIGKSLLQTDNIISRAKELGYESVALCDEMSLHGMVDFTNEAKKVGIRPIIGCKLRVYQNPTYRKPSKASGEKEKPNPHYLLNAYVKDERGITSLMRLLTKANTPENFYYHSRCSIEDVLALEGVVITTGDFFGLFRYEGSLNVLERLNGRFGDDLFAELVPINTPLFDTLNSIAIKSARALSVNTVVSYPALYLNATDADALDVLSVITTNGRMSVSYRPKQFVKDFVFDSDDKLLPRVLDAVQRLERWYGEKDTSVWEIGLKNINTIADRCLYTFSKMPVSLPLMASNEFMALGRKCIEGWGKRLTKPVLGYLPPPELLPVYQERLSYELSTLKAMGFCGYFLLVEDMISWAKSQEILVGPGRGSAGGSLVAYLVGITDVDPIRFNLLFERFINPERLDLPDADIDFMSSKRHLVVEYLVSRYGANCVAGISNYSTLASASALRDAGRVFGLSGLDLMATKLVPKEHGQSFTLTEAAVAVPEISKFKTENPEIWNVATKLEGVMRSFGQHAAGVVIGGEPLVNRSVVETRSESSCISWDKRIVEDWGLVKMDLLGLSTLDVLEIAKEYIKSRHGVNVDYLSLSLDDPKVMDSFGRGDTTGVFQFDGSGMKKLLRDLSMGGRLTFEDITAATALYRPGPMDSGLMADYVQIKQGFKIPYYDHPNMENALSATYSVIVYQEQVMQISRDLAGFTGAEADFLRKAMGKKDKDKMAEMRQKWIDGCYAKSGMDKESAEMLFDKIEAFAGYGFNKSHATAYSIISYWTMWLRTYYSAEYFAACMSIVKEDKLSGLVLDARNCKIEVLPPDINLSTDKFTILDNEHILAPFSAVKGISENTARRIMELRDRNRDWKVVRTKRTGEEVWGVDEESSIKGRFETVKEFECAAAEPGSKVSIRVVENLGKVGAFAAIDPSSKPARHHDRRRDQMELMPGLIIDSVKADRTTDTADKFVRAKVIHLVRDYKTCKNCDLCANPHPTIRVKNTVKFMVVSDCPSWQEEKADKLLEGDAAEFIKASIKEAGLSVGDGYYTALVKAKKQDKFLTNDQINSCKGFLEKEIELIKPPIIVALGNAAMKHFLPGFKGSSAEMVGKVIFDPRLDASIVCGLNAQQIIFDPAKASLLTDVFRKVSDILE